MLQLYFKPLLISSLSLLPILTSHASTPLWIFSSPSPALVNVADGEKVEVSYTITNQSLKPKSLSLKTTKALDASPCYLAGKGSTCTLVLTIDGSQIPNQGMHIGPVLCDTANANQCYQPSINNFFQINKKNSPEKEKYWSTVGYNYNNATLQPNALSYISNDKGKTWIASYQLPPAPENATDVVLTSVSCALNGQCTSVGFYSSPSLPLSYSSGDYGANWALSSSLPPSVGSGDHQLVGVSCDQAEHCTAIGEYSDGSTGSPLSYISNDFGSGWSLSNTLPAPPIGSVSSKLNGISCISTGQCIAVGVYNDGSAELPFSTISNDQGNNWSLSNTLPSPPLGAVNTSLRNISCESTGHCVAVGYYDNGINSALIYFSNDYGNNWNTSNSLPLPPGSISSELSSVSCDSIGRCVAIGAYNNGSFPFSYISTDYGVNWALSDTFPLPSGVINAILTSVSCDLNGNCAAVGTYAINTSLLPLSYSSNDYGAHWTLSTFLWIPENPSVYLYGVSST